MKKILLLLALLFPVLTFASPATDLNALLASLTSMQADFTQVIYDNKHRPVQTSYGKMAFNRPNQFRWEVTKPIPQLIITNGAKLYIYDKDLEQLTIRKLQAAVGETPALLLSHPDQMNLEKNYDVTLVKETTYRLVPKKPDSAFAFVEMIFTQNQINGMRLQDNLGHLTNIDFSHAVSNLKLSPSLFTFKPPKGVDVIDETKKR